MSTALQDAGIERLRAHIEAFRATHDRLPDWVCVDMDFYMALPMEHMQNYSFQAEGDDVVSGYITYMEIPVYYFLEERPGIIYSPIRESAIDTSDPYSEFYEPPDDGEEQTD